MPAGTNIFLPLRFNQLVDLIKKLPAKDKQKLLHVLEEDSPDAIPGWQKREVLKRIRKYERHPELLIDEKAALKMIKAI